MQDFLKALNIKSQNEGCSTGLHWINSKGEKIDSFSPVVANSSVLLLQQIKKVMKK
jgi:hypothetical protein